jgi:hypothetical protein
MIQGYRASLAMVQADGGGPHDVEPRQRQIDANQHQKELCPIRRSIRIHGPLRKRPYAAPPAFRWQPDEVQIFCGDTHVDVHIYHDAPDPAILEETSLSEIFLFPLVFSRSRFAGGDYVRHLCKHAHADMYASSHGSSPR